MYECAYLIARYYVEYCLVLVHSFIRACEEGHVEEVRPSPNLRYHLPGCGANAVRSADGILASCSEPRSAAEERTLAMAARRPFRTDE